MYNGLFWHYTQYYGTVAFFKLAILFKLDIFTIKKAKEKTYCTDKQPLAKNQSGNCAINML
jgi:hypothetical protein